MKADRRFFHAALRRVLALGPDERGGTALIFGLVALFLVIPAALIGVDVYVAASQKSRLQDSLDAATLFAARSGAVTNEALQLEGEKSLKANLEIVGGDPTALLSYSFTISDDARNVTGVATVKPTSFFNWCREYRGDNFCWIGGPVTTTSTVNRGGQDLEVALVLDTTGSMAGQKIIDLRAAATELVDIVVKDQQTPFYSKVAVAPYSMAVNVGPWAENVRGPITPGVSITGASQTNPVTITAPGHGLSAGDRVYIKDVAGMTNLNNNWYNIANVTTDTFRLAGVDGRFWSAYTGGGKAYCTEEGCEYFLFKSNWMGLDRIFPVSTCATERNGGNAYTDAAPSTTKLGRNYAGTANPCPTTAITPLSSDKAALKAKIASLNASGSTAGHLGVAWGWYLLSPKFAYLFTGAQQPAAYDKPDLVKAVVLMTDGEFNTGYCKGVIAKDSTTGSGSPLDHINCNAPNGHAFDQAKSLCTQMKAQDVIVYTVGFDVADLEAAKEIMRECATSPSHVYYPDTGVELKEAFKAIAQELSRLRISR